ncbi:MAG: hypothetical protein KBG64_04890 [Clostridia bacterium]|nr:hypothetical protein [Clostridia bacterium]
MPYCVHCGVELDPSEKYCPLCHVEVIDPLAPYDEKVKRPYPTRLDPITQRINRRFVGVLISIVLGFSALLCTAINFSLENKLTWSLYVIGALFLLWSWTVPYFLVKKRSFIRLFLPGVFVLLAYLYLIAWLQGGLAWYFSLAVPLVLQVAILVCLNSFLIRKHFIRGFTIPAVLLISTGLLVTGLEWTLNRYKGSLTFPSWSLYVLIPCLALALACFSIARRQAVLDEIKRRLHL